MSNKTRKYVWRGAVAMSIAVVGVLAAFLVLGSNPTVTDAHGGAQDSTHCDGLSRPQQLQHDLRATEDDTDPTSHTCADASDAPAASTGNGGNGGNGGVSTGNSVTSSSDSASAGVKLTLNVMAADDLLPGSSVELYLEDDFAVPDDINPGDVYFYRSGVGRIYVIDEIEINDSDHFTAGKDDWAIQVFVPDMNPGNDTGFDNWPEGMIELVFTKGAGIKNPKEKGTHSVGATILAPNGDANDGPMYSTAKAYAKDSDAAGEAQGSNKMVYLGMHDSLAEDVSGHDVGLKTVAKIALDDEDNKRGYELTATGSGFKPGVDVSVWVLNAATKPESCEALVDDPDATVAGTGTVGSDAKAAVVFEVTVPTFMAGSDNHLCMLDGSGRDSADVDSFKLEPSIKVVPATANAGDTVNVFAQDYEYSGGSALDFVKIAGEVVVMSGPALNSDGSAAVAVVLPGRVGGVPLQGTVRIDASWGGTSKNANITIGGAQVMSSKTDVLPNETITITGNGFGTGKGTCISVNDIKLDNVPVSVAEESEGCEVTNADDTKEDGVEVSSAGQFVATVTVWPAPVAQGEAEPANPSLIAGTHRLTVVDSKGFSGMVVLTIAEPTIMVTPGVAGPRDYITITGENWPVDSLDNPLTKSVMVEVNDSRSRTYPVYPDSVGRFTVEHRVHRLVAIPSTNQIKATYSDVVKVGSFAVPASTITVTPSEAQPGDMISLTAANMPVYAEADYVEIGGTTYNDPGANTDRDGNITIDDVLVPGLDPGTYSVVMSVDDTISIGELRVLAESAGAGAPTELPGAVEALGGSLVAIFHFDDVGKEWSFYDPRPEFADLNTLTEMVNGEAYWILVSETVDDVVLNNKARSLTCRGADCWNLEVW